MSSEMKTCQNCKASFKIDASDFEFYAKIKVPTPTWCPECRMVRRMNFRNARTVYKRKIIGVNTEVFSSFPPDSSLVVYDQNYWWSDNWNPMQYGQDYDFSKPFFTQLKELMRKMPWSSGYNLQSTNSDYCNNVIGLKDCYLLFNSGFSESCFYGSEISECHNVLDSTKVVRCELSRELLDCEKCNHTFFSQDCIWCSEVYFSQNLVDCHNCFGCVNLRHKKYHIFNKQYTQEEYEKFFNEVNLGSYKTIETTREKVKAHYLIFPKRYMHGYNNNDVSGDYLDHSKNTHNSFLCREMEDCKHCQLILFLPSRDMYDMTVAGGELCYEVGEGGGYAVKFSWMTIPKNLKTKQLNISEMEYSMNIFNSSNLFACIGLRNKQYCILNKQYSKEEYEQLVPKIIEHMNAMPYIDKKGRIYKYGEFFPSELSPFSYNETIAQEYFPLTKEQAIEQGYNWKDPEERNIKIDLKTEELKDNIKDVDDDILNKVIQCATFSRHSEQGEESQRSFANSQDNWTPEMFGCTTAFKIIKPELEFYRKMNLPLPRLCPNCRHYQRLKQRNPLKLWKRQCMCNGANSQPTTNNLQQPNYQYQNTIAHFHGTEPCSNTFETTYSSERPEIVYCEKCYQSEVV